MPVNFSKPDLQINREEPLTDADRRFIKRRFRKTFFIASAVIGVIGIAFLVSFQLVLSVTGVVILALIYPIRNYLLKSQNEILKKDIKLVTRGVISAHFTTTTPFGSGKSRNRNYFIHIGERKFQVPVQMFNHYRLGDAVEFHSVDNQKKNAMIIWHSKLKEPG
jgi:hypothetical protein